MKGIENFQIEEFLCHCPNPNCEGKDPTKLNNRLVFTMQLLCYNINQPVIITRGLVCWNWHITTYKKIYGDRWEEFITKTSTHLTGEGADFYAKNFQMKSLYIQCEKIDIGFSGLGIYPNSHIHADVSDKRYNRWICKNGIYTYLF